MPTALQIYRLLLLSTMPVANEYDLDCSTPAPVRPEPAGKKGHTRQHVFYKDRGFPGSLGLLNRHMYWSNGRVVSIRRFSLLPPAPPGSSSPSICVYLTFIEEEHSPKLDKGLDLSCLSASVGARV